MTQALVARAEFVEAMGLIVLQTDGRSVAAMREACRGALAQLSPGTLPAGLHERRKGAIPARLVPALTGFFGRPAVFAALGGLVAMWDWQQGLGCVVGEGCTGERVMSQGVFPLPLCWHHDNAHRAGELPALDDLARRQLLQFGLARVAAWSGREGGASVAELCWWAVSHRLGEMLPAVVLAHGLNRRWQDDARDTGLGFRETDARFTQRDHIADLREMVKPIRFEVDPEPASVHMLRPKPRRWHNEAYLAWVRTQPCVATGVTEAVEAHHVIGHGESGMAIKAHDLFAFPLCHAEHQRLHSHGWQRWEHEHGSQWEHVIHTQRRALELGVIG